VIELSGQALAALPLAQAAPGGGMDGLMSFLIIRPQQKRDREKQDMLSSMGKGDHVVTIGGVCGTVVGVTDSHVVVRVDDNTKIEFIKSAIAQVRKDDKKTEDK
jgi:preprotein translocase subunit YajC